MVIIFNCEKPRRQLLEKGEVITFRRKERRRLGKDWMTDKRGGRKLCDVFIEQIYFIPTKSTMRGFLWGSLDKSGFDTIDEWLIEIEKINKKQELTKGWLYLVTRV